MNNTEFLRYGNSYAQMVEKHSLLLRKISMVHPKVMASYRNETDQLIKNIDCLLMETEGSNFKIEKVLELRRLIYQFEYIVNFKIIESYNNLIDKMSSVASAPESIQTKIPDHIYLALQDKEVAKEPNDVWESVCGYLKAKLNVHTYNVWVKPVKYHSCNDKMIKVWVQNNYYKNWLEEHCSSIINDHLSSNNMDYEVRFITG